MIDLKKHRTTACLDKGEVVGGKKKQGEGFYLVPMSKRAMISSRKT